MREVSPKILLLLARNTRISTISSADASSAPLAAAIIWCEGNADLRTNSSKRAMVVQIGELYPIGSRTHAVAATFLGKVRLPKALCGRIGRGGSTSAHTQISMDKRSQIAVYHPLNVAHFGLRAMVLNQPIRCQDIRPNLR